MVNYEIKSSFHNITPNNLIVDNVILGKCLCGIKRGNVHHLLRDVARWLERGALSMSLSAVRFRIPLGAGFSLKYHVFPLSILGHNFDFVSLGNLCDLFLAPKWLQVLHVPNKGVEKVDE